MNKQEAAKLLGVSVRTLERRMRKGNLKFSRVGGGRFAEVSFNYADLCLPEPETGPPAAVSSPDLAAGDPAVRPKTHAPMVEPLTPLPISHAERLPDPLTFKDSMGNGLFDKNPVSLLGSGFRHDASYYRNQDSRTNITHERITYTHGNARVPSGFKQNLGYGTNPDDLQAEINFYKRHPREAMRRFGPR